MKESHELETALEKKLAERRGQSGHGTPDRLIPQFLKIFALHSNLSALTDLTYFPDPNYSSAEAQLRGKASLAEESIKSLRENLVNFSSINHSNQKMVS